MFDSFDDDHCGRVRSAEVRELFSELRWHVEQSEVDDRLQQLFGETTSSLTFEMFLRLYCSVIAKQPYSVRKSRLASTKGARINIVDLREIEGDLRRLFKEVDVDHSGYLCLDEMREVLRRSGLPDPDGDDYETASAQHMALADENNDGELSFEEFIHYRNAVLDYISEMDEEMLDYEEETDAPTVCRFID